jgi:hypothetical protein
MDVSFLDSLEPEGRKVRSSLSFSRSEASLWLSEGESESDEPVDVAPATTPRRPTPARPRASILRRESRRLTAALLSWQRSVAVPESLFSELEGKRRRDGSRKAHAAPRFVAAPDSWLALAFSATGFVLTLTHVALLTPAFVAFDAPTRLGAPAEPWPWPAAVDFGVGVFFLLNLLANFRTGVLCSSRTLGRVAAVLDPASIARVYVASGTFACDAAALLPLFAQCVSSAWLALEGTETAASRHVSRLIRLFRLFHAARFFKNGSVVGGAEALLSRGTVFTPLLIWLAQTACEFVFVIHTCACAFVYVAHVEGFETSWVDDALRDDVGPTSSVRVRETFAPVDVYVCALYWAAATVSTVGYGDVSATNRTERITAVAVMTAGGVYFASLVGRVAALVERHGDASRRREAYREKLLSLRCFLRRHPNVPRDLRLRLFFFFSDTWTKTRASRGSFVANDRALLAELPDALRRETNFRALETAARAAFADDAAESEEEEKISERALRAVADALEPRLVSRNERLDAANTFALVREGEVEVALSSHPSSEKKGAFADDHDEKTNVDREPSRRVVVEAGAFFGVASFLRSEDRQTRIHARVEAVAVSECEVYEMDAERAGALGDEFPELRRGAERALALRDF